MIGYYGYHMGRSPQIKSLDILHQIFFNIFETYVTYQYRIPVLQQKAFTGTGLFHTRPLPFSGRNLKTPGKPRKKHCFWKGNGMENMGSIRKFQQQIPCETTTPWNPTFKECSKAKKTCCGINRHPGLPCQWHFVCQIKFIPMNMENLKLCHYKGMLTILSTT